MIASIRELLPALYNCIEFLSIIDFYCALARYSSLTHTVRPLFGAKTAIRQGRHPILDFKNRDVVPNDINASPDTCFFIIAGPNMAGKSTYIRQVCLLQIMAQCGCMVPANYACFMPMTRVFSRIGHNDDLTQHLSGFAVEVVFLLNHGVTASLDVRNVGDSTTRKFKFVDHRR